MRTRLVFIVLSLLLLVTVICYLGHPAKDKISHRVPPVPPASAKVTGASSGAAASGITAHTNAPAPADRYAYRLTNTKKSLNDLMKDKRALMLENALIDTGAKLDLAIPAKLKSKEDPGAYFVQAANAVDRPFRQALTAAGAQEVSYIPNNALLVRATADVAGQLRQNPLVAAVIPYEPFYKLSPELARIALGQQPMPANPEYKISIFPGQAQQGADELSRAGFTINSSSYHGYLLEVSGGDYSQLALLTSPHNIELVHSRKAANDLARMNMGVSVDTITNADYLNLYGSNVLVEMNDSGVDKTHPDLSPRVMGDFASSLVDDDGHGTHVAGIIAGSGLESPTINVPPNLPAGSVSNANFRGKAPAAHLLVVGNIFDGGSDEYLQSVPAQTNALISNNSWGYDDSEYDLAAASYDAAVRDALPFVTGSQPVLFVFAAGNNGNGNDDGTGGNSDTISSPATAKNVVSVGALEQFRQITNIVTDLQGNSNAVWFGETSSANAVPGFSSRGNVGVGLEGPGGRFKPDVVAPGTFVVSTRSSTWNQAAYFNPTNYFEDVYTNQTVGTNGVLAIYGEDLFGYYSNVVAINITVTPNANSPSPFPSNVPVYVTLNGTPTATAYDIKTTDNQLSIPPSTGGAITGIQSMQDNAFTVGVGNSSTNPISFDLSVQIVSTNDLGNYLEVLSNLDETLSPYYRYETGTSMAAPAVSGVLALIQDYFTNTLHLTPSPALLKAMLINGARSQGNYTYAIGADVNSQGWGLAQLPTSLQPGTTNGLGAASSELFVDQSPTNALVTGDRHTYNVLLTNAAAYSQPLRITLVWTDPPGDPAAAIKLVNNLDLVVTNLATGDIYYGNNFYYGSSSSGSSLPPYSVPWITNTPPPADVVNNVENVFLSSFNGTNFAVSVVASDVNVNAVTAQTNDIAQDFALVITSGDGAVSNAFVVTDNGVTHLPTSDQQISYVVTTNQPLFNQIVGASSPLLGTNTLSLGAATQLIPQSNAPPIASILFATNAVLTIGETNQWHFYVVTNNTTYTNAAFITFLPATLSIPRMGVLADSLANATRPEADIDLFVSTNSSITNLNPQAIADCVNNVGLSRASLSRGGTEFVAYQTPEVVGKVFYIGIQSEDQMGSEFDFMPIFSLTPFSALNPDGSQTVFGMPLPQSIPDGTPYLPGSSYVFALAIYPMQVAQVIVTNDIYSGNFGDLAGYLNHGGESTVLNNHDGGVFGLNHDIYDDVTTVSYPGLKRSDGPGSLRNFIGGQAVGPWILTERDNAADHSSTNENFTMLIIPHQPFNNNAIRISLQPGAWFYDYIDVPAGYTNLFVTATNLLGSAIDQIRLYVQTNGYPTLDPTDTNFVYLTNGVPPGNDISVGPPLVPGRYYVGLYNPTANSVAVTILLDAILSFDAAAIETVDYDSDGPTKILDDAVTYSSINVPNTNIIQSLNVGLRVTHPRISDVSFHLISPDGTRYLLMENRGGTTTNGAGATILVTNTLPVSSNGSAVPNTNSFDTGTNAGTVVINYNMYTLPDEMVVYNGTNLLADTGFVSGTGTLTLNYTNSPIITIEMNPNGNTNSTTLWTYTATSTLAKYSYLDFTENTNLANTPIKFAPTPFVSPTPEIINTNNQLVIADFEGYPESDYVPGQTVRGTSVQVTSKLASVVTDPSVAFGGSNTLALADATLAVSLPTTPGQQYILSFAYRGPGAVGLWRGEDNVNDSIAGNTAVFYPGSGVLGYSAGLIGQAFETSGAGNHIYIPDSPAYAVTSYTYEIWMKTQDGQGLIFNRGDSRPGNDAIDLGFVSPGLLSFSYDSDIDASVGLTYQLQNYLNQWVHLAAVRNAATGLVGLYVNGVRQSQIFTVTNPLTILQSDSSVGIGNAADLGNDFNFDGLLDEATIYNRALSPSEIKAIYNQGIAGQAKYDVNAPAPFSQSLAEATITVGTNGPTTFYGQNAAWQTMSIPFTATGTNTIAQIQGLEPGMLLDHITLGTPSTTKTSIYYLPEQSIAALNGQPANGLWQLEMLDSRVGGGLTNNNFVNSWQLEFTFANLGDGLPLPVAEQTQTSITAPNSLTWYEVQVPSNANYATNQLIFATGPVNFLYSPNNPPTTNNPGDQVLATSVTTNSTLFNLTNTTPALVDGSTYFLGVQNTNAFAVTNAVRVDFDSAFFTNLSPLFLTAPANTNINALKTLVITNAATDPDPNLTLAYSLLNPPAGATIDAHGVITWTPTLPQESTTYTITTVVVNSEDPPLGATNSFTVTVNVTASLPSNFAISNIVKTNLVGTKGYLLSWYAPTNFLFQVKWSDPLTPTTWHTFTNVISYKTNIPPTNGLYQFFDDGSQDGGLGIMRFYRVYLY